MSSNFLEQMAQFNQRIGKPMPDPTRIEGFGSPNDPPPPPLREDVRIPSAVEMYGDPVEHEMTPLERVAKAPQAAPPVRLTDAQVKEMMDAEPPAPMPDLIVLGTSASLSGHAVILSALEEAAVKEVVIRAVERSMKDQRDALRNLLPRRGRPARGKDAPQASKDAPGTTSRPKSGKGAK